MRLNRLFSVAMLSFLFGVSASAQQPYGGCWHPEHIKNWSPETDKNAKQLCVQSQHRRAKHRGKHTFGTSPTHSYNS
jgi:hypothetical protein